MELNLSSVMERAWAVAKKHGVWVLLVYIMNSLASNIAQQGMNTQRLVDLMTEYSETGDMNSALKHFNEYNVLESMGSSIAIALLLSFLMATFFSLVINKLLWRGVSDCESKPDLADAFKSSVNNHLWKYLVVNILHSLAIFGATLCCILPGVFVCVRLLFVPIIAANRSDLSIGEVFAYSWQLTRGHFWTLLGYGIVAIFVNILGFCCCCVGVCLTGVYTMFMLAECYHVLATESSNTDDQNAYQQNY